MSRARRWWLVVGAVLLAAVLAAVAYGSSVRPQVHPGRPGSPLAPRASVARLTSTLAALPGPRSPTDAAALGVAEELAFAALVSQGYSVYRDEVRHEPGSTHRHPPTHSVLTAVPPAGPVWMVAAHLDSVSGSPGADDDASGVAVVLEVARLVSGREGARHVVFALFNEEETGLLGSRQYVDDVARRLGARLAGLVVLDAVGFYAKGAGTQAAPFPLSAFVPDEADFLSAITLDEALAARLVAVRDAAAPTFTLATFAPPRLLAEALPDLWRSDHAPFWRAGLPAVFVTDTANFRNGRYHRPDDVPGSLDVGRLAQVADLVAGLVERP